MSSALPYLGSAILSETGKQSPLSRLLQGNQTEVALADGSSTPPWVHCRVIRGVSVSVGSR